MTVEALMTRDVKTCRPDDTLNLAANIMWEQDCGCVPVVDEGRRVVGMLTDRDVCMAAYISGQPLSGLTISGAMSRGIRPCRREHAIAEAEEVMRANRVRRLPVVDEEGRLLGLLSLSDIVLATAAGKGRSATAAKALVDTLAAISSRRLSRDASLVSPGRVTARPRVPRRTRERERDPGAVMDEPSGPKHTGRGA
jgi:CBS domain-containing protein